MTRPSSTFWLLAGASALLVASCAWFGAANVRALAARRGVAKTMVRLSGASYEPVGRDAPVVKTERWEAPPAQRRGAEWIYDVFTPPEIFYDPRTRQFSITPPSLEAPAEQAAPPAPFGLELVAVKRVPYRLQLVGYAGGAGNYRGLFENALTSETFLATRGRKLPALDVTIEEFEVARQSVALPDSMTTSRLVATAVVRDARTGERVTLTSLERFYPGAAVATVRREGAEEARDLREGEQWSLAGAVYRVDRIQLSPASVDLTKTTGDQPPEQRTLTAPPASLPNSASTHP